MSISIFSPDWRNEILRELKDVQRAGPLAWLNFDGNPSPTIRDSLSVTSVTRNAQGDYTVNYTSSLSSNASVQVTAGDTASPALYSANIVEISTAMVRFQIRDVTGTAVDVDTVCVTINGRVIDFLLLEGDALTGPLDKISLEGDAAPGVLLTDPLAS